MRRIKVSRPIGWLAAIGTVAIMASLILIQSRTILEMRQEISSLHAEKEQLVEQARNTETVSSDRIEAGAPKVASEQPSQELLRLRGEVSVLRQQITALQEPSPESLSAEKRRQLETFRRDIGMDSVRLKVISDEMHDAKVSSADRAQIILSAGCNDPVLDSLVEQLFMAEQWQRRLAEESGDNHGDVQDARKKIADLNDKLDKRCRGILMGLEERVLSMKVVVEKLEAELQQGVTGSQ